MTRWIVVGGGAAGSVIAARLSDDEANEVTLIEAGRDHGSEPTPGDRGPFFGDPDRVVTYPVRRQPDRSTEPYALGAGLGGSSLINGSIVVPRGPGGDGGHAIPLESPERVGPLGTAVLAADAGAERLLLTTDMGRRVTAADAYLRPVLDRPNLMVTTGTAVARLVIDGRRVTGVEMAGGGVLAADRVVVAAGAIGTPLLLLRSGIDTTGVGQHLQDHPAFSIPLLLDGDAAPGDTVAHDITVATTTSTHQIIALERTAADSPYGALVVGLVDTTSRGSIELDTDDRPVVSLNQLGTPDDVDRMTGAVLDAIDIAEHASLRAVATERFADDRGTPLAALDRDRDALGDWVARHLTGFHHVAGTCRRGEVTDADGWVRGYGHLAIGDASLFERLPATNVYLSTVLQAEELAGRWTGRER